MVFNENLNNRASWTEGRQKEGWTDRWTDFPCVLQDFVPFGAAALLPLNLNYLLLKQGTGTADHLLPLGCYYFSYLFGARNFRGSNDLLFLSERLFDETNSRDKRLEFIRLQRRHVIAALHRLCFGDSLRVYLRIFSRVLRDSTPRFVRPSVRQSVRWSVTLYFFGVNGVFGLTAPAQMLH